MDRRSSSRLITATGAVAAWVVVGAVAAVLATVSAAQASPVVTAPVAQTGDVTGLTDASATLNGTVSPSEPTALTFFEWGFSADYGRTTPEVHLTGADAQPVIATLTGLVPATTYHYRLLAANGTGTTRTPDATFTTAAAPASASITSTGVVGSSTGPAAYSPDAATLASSTATAATRAPVLTVGRGGTSGTPTVSTRRVKKPSIRLPVTCASGLTCSGSLTVLVPRKPSKTDGPISVSVASASFVIPSGTRVPLKMAITASDRALIAAAKRAGQLETATISLDGQPSTQQRFTLANQPR